MVVAVDDVLRVFVMRERERARAVRPHRAPAGIGSSR